MRDFLLHEVPSAIPELWSRLSPTSIISSSNPAGFERLRRGELSLGEVERLAQHIEGCAACTQRVVTKD